MHALIILPELIRLVGLHQAIIVQQVHLYTMELRREWLSIPDELWRASLSFLDERDVSEAKKDLREKGILGLLWPDLYCLHYDVLSTQVSTEVSVDSRREEVSYPHSGEVIHTLLSLPPFFPPLSSLLSLSQTLSLFSLLSPPYNPPSLFSRTTTTTGDNNGEEEEKEKEKSKKEKEKEKKEHPPSFVTSPRPPVSSEIERGRRLGGVDRLVLRAEHYDFAQREGGISDEKIVQRITAEFRDYYRSRGFYPADVDALWRNWVRRYRGPRTRLKDV